MNRFEVRLKDDCGIWYPAESFKTIQQAIGSILLRHARRVPVAPHVEALIHDALLGEVAARLNAAGELLEVGRHILEIYPNHLFAAEATESEGATS